MGSEVLICNLDIVFEHALAMSGAESEGTGAWLLVVQVAFVGHDAGHNAVAHNSKYDGYIGLLVNACIGIGPSWWKVLSLLRTVVLAGTMPCPRFQ